MIFYFIIIFYWLVLLVKEKKQITNKRLFWAILPMFLIVALKSLSVGSDTISYYARYIGAVDMLIAEQSITEPGYNLLSYFFHDILGVPFWAFNAIVSAFVCFILGLFLKFFSCNIYLSLIVYMTIGLFGMSMTGLRQMIAISICMIPIIWSKKHELQIESSRKHKIWFYILGGGCVMLAFTFHNSAVVVLPVLFLANIRLSRIQTIIIVFVAIATLIFRGSVVNLMSRFVLEKYEIYDLNEGYLMNILYLLVPIAISLFCVFTIYPENGEHRYSKQLSLLFIYLALYVMFNNLALNHAQIGRLGFYFMNAELVLIPLALKNLTREFRQIVTVVVITLCLTYFYLGTTGSRIDNYKFFWQEKIYLNN